MFENMQTQAAPFIRAFRQAPWRTQTQAVAAWSVTLLVIAVVGGLYLAVASRAATAGRDLQALEARKTELSLENDRLRAEMARLRAVARLADRAQALGYKAAAAEQIEYLAVPDFPENVQTTPPPRAAVLPPAPETTVAVLGQWLVQTLAGMMTGLSQRLGR